MNHSIVNETIRRRTLRCGHFIIIQENRMGVKMILRFFPVEFCAIMFSRQGYEKGLAKWIIH